MFELKGREGRKNNLHSTLCGRLLAAGATHEITRAMSRHFEIKYLGEVIYFIGIQIGQGVHVC